MVLTFNVIMLAGEPIIRDKMVFNLKSEIKFFNFFAKLE